MDVADIVVAPSADAKCLTEDEKKKHKGAVFTVVVGEDSKKPTPLATMAAVYRAAEYAAAKGAKTINLHFVGVMWPVAFCVGSVMQQRFFGKDVALYVADRLPDGTDTLVKV